MFFLKTSQERSHWSLEVPGLRARKRPSSGPKVWRLEQNSSPLTAVPRPRRHQPHTPGARLGDSGGRPLPSSPRYSHWGAPAEQDKCPSAACTPAAGRCVRECSWHARMSPSPQPHTQPCCSHWGSAGPNIAHPSRTSSPGLYQAPHLPSTLHRPGTGPAAPNPAGWPSPAGWLLPWSLSPGPWEQACPSRRVTEVPASPGGDP